MPAIKRGDLTMSDMVLLRLLAERPMHGHRASLELARFKFRTGMGVSRPQVYWSLNKLEKMGLICEIDRTDPPAPRQRRVFMPTIESQKVFDTALGRTYWTTQLPRSLFLTWVLLAQDLAPKILYRQVQRRVRFIEKELRQASATLKALNLDHHESADTVGFSWVVRLEVEQFANELRWLRKLAPLAKNPRKPVSTGRKAPASLKLFV